MSCGPPNVRAARRARRASCRRGRRAASPAGRRVVGVAHAAAPRQRQLDAVDLATHETVRPARHGRHDQAVEPAGDGIGAEQHTAVLGDEERLHQDADRSVAARAHHVGRPQRRTPPTRVRRGPRRTCRPSIVIRRPRRPTTSGRSARAARRWTARPMRPRGRRPRRRTPAPPTSLGAADVVTTKPGRAGSPAARAAGQGGGLRPDEAASRPASSSRPTTTAMVTGGAVVALPTPIASSPFLPDRCGQRSARRQHQQTSVKSQIDLCAWSHRAAPSAAVDSTASTDRRAIGEPPECGPGGRPSSGGKALIRAR